MGNLTEEELLEYQNFLFEKLGINDKTQLYQRKREIVLTCHPDKTKDPSKYQEFTRFMKFYDLYRELEGFQRQKTNKQFKQTEVLNSPTKLLTGDQRVLERNKEGCLVFQNEYFKRVNERNLIKISECLVKYPEMIPEFAKKYYRQSNQIPSLWLLRSFEQYHVLEKNLFLPKKVSGEKFSNYLFLIDKLPKSWLNYETEDFLLSAFLTTDLNSQLVIQNVLKRLGHEQKLLPLQKWKDWWEKNEQNVNIVLEQTDLDYYANFYETVLEGHNLLDYQRLKERVVYPSQRPDWLVNFLNIARTVNVSFAQQQVLSFTLEEERKRRAFLEKAQLTWIEHYYSLIPLKQLSELNLYLDFLEFFHLSEQVWRNYLGNNQADVVKQQQLFLLKKWVFPRWNLDVKIQQELELFLDNELPWETKLRFLMVDFNRLQQLLDVVIYLNNYRSYLAFWALEDYTGKNLRALLEKPLNLTLEKIQIWLTSVKQGAFLNPEQFWEQFVQLNGHQEKIIAISKPVYEETKKAYQLYPTLRLESFEQHFPNTSLKNKPLARWQVPGDLKACLLSYGGRKNYANCLKKQRQNNDYYRWFQEVNTQTSLLERLLVMIEAGKLKFGYIPHFSQLFSAVLPLYFDKGSLLQIGTGEGKSYIIALHALLRATYQAKVDISTTIPPLSKRDAEMYAPFFAMFGLVGGELSWKVWRDLEVENDQPERENRDLYHSNILYGDIESYIGDDLQDVHYHDLRRSRPFDGVHIVDEVDYLFLDRNDHAVMIGNKFPGHDSFRLLFIDLWHFTNQVLNTLEVNDEFCALSNENEDYIEDHNQLFKVLVKVSSLFQNQTQVPVEDCENWLFNTLTERLLYQGTILLPQHLHSFLQSQKTTLINNLINAFYLESYKDFLLERRDGFTTLEPMELSTGIEMEKVRLIGGLHTFLSLKQNILLPEETIVSLEETYAYYYRKYQKLVDLSGTLGTTSDLKIFREIYNLESIIIPAFISKRVVSLPVIWAKNEQEWYLKIAREINFYHQAHRTVLVIMESMQEVMNLENCLLQSFPRIGKPILYVNSKNDEDHLSKQLAERDIVLATNLGGRGTDFKLSYVSTVLGGGHLIKTKLSANRRIDDQAIGRVGRQGQPGSYQFILNLATELSDEACEVPEQIENDRIAAQNLYDCLFDVREQLAEKNYKANLEQFNWLQKKQRLRELRTEEERNWLMPFLPNLSFGKPSKELFEIGIFLEKERLFANNGDKKVDLTDEVLKLRQVTFNNLKKKVIDTTYLLNFYDDQVLRFLLIKHGFSKVFGLDFYLALQKQVEQQIAINVNKELADYSPEQKDKYYTLILLRVLLKEIAKFVDNTFVERISLQIKDKSQQQVTQETLLLHLVFQTWLEKNQMSSRQLLKKQLDETWSIFVANLTKQFVPEEAIKSWVDQKRNFLQKNQLLNNAIYYHQLVEYYQHTYDPLVEKLNFYYWTLIADVPYQQRINWCQKQSLTLEQDHYLAWIRILSAARYDLNQDQQGLNKDIKENQVKINEAKQRFVQQLNSVMDGISYHLEFHKTALLEIAAQNQEEVIFHLSFINRLNQIYQLCQNDLILVRDSKKNEKVLFKIEDTFTAQPLNLTNMASNLGLDYDVTAVPEITELCDRQLKDNGFQKHVLYKVKLQSVLLKKLGTLGIGVLEMVCGSALLPFSKVLGSSLIVNGIDTTINVLNAMIEGKDFSFRELAINSLLNSMVNYAKSLLFSFLDRFSLGRKDKSDQADQTESIKETIFGKIRSKINDLVTNMALDYFNKQLVLRKDWMIKEVKENINKISEQNREILNRIVMLDYLNGNHLMKQHFEQLSLDAIKQLAQDYYADNYRKVITVGNNRRQLKELIDQVEKGLSSQNYVARYYQKTLEDLEQQLPSLQQLFDKFSSQRAVEKGISIEDRFKQATLAEIQIEFENRLQEEYQAHFMTMQGWLNNLGTQFTLSVQQSLNNNFKKLELTSAHLLVDSIQQYHVEQTKVKQAQAAKENIEILKNVNEPVNQQNKFKKKPAEVNKKILDKKRKQSPRKPKVSQRILINHAWLYDEVFPNKYPEQIEVKLDDYEQFALKELLKSERSAFLTEEEQWQKFNLLINPVLVPIEQDEPFFKKVSHQVEYIGNLNDIKSINEYLNKPFEDHYFRVNNAKELMDKMPPNSLVIGERPLHGRKFQIKNPDSLTKYTTKLNRNWRVLHRQIFYIDDDGKLHNIGLRNNKDPLFEEDLSIISEYRFGKIATNIANLKQLTDEAVQRIKNQKKPKMKYHFFNFNCQHLSEEVITFVLTENGTSYTP